MSSAEDIFRPAFEEIARRSSVARSENATVTNETTYFARDDQSSHFQFELPNQNVALVTMGTSVLAPRPLDPLRPSLRVYGAFASAEEATEHAEVVQELDPTCSLVVVPMREWFLLPQNEESRDNLEYRKKRLETRLQDWRVKQIEDGDSFDRRVSEHLEAEGSSIDPHDEDKEEVEEAEAIVYKPPKRLRSGGEVRGQGALTLCVIPDNIVGECIVKILGCFENSNDADAWSRNIGTRRVTDDDIFVAPTCEWLFPNGEPKTATHYRNGELQRIMDAAERNPQAVKDYKAWKEEQDRQPPPEQPTE